VKLLNQSLQYLSFSMLLIVSFWAVIFYINMLDEIHDSIDDGLDNYKLLIMQKAERNKDVLAKDVFDEGNYAIHEIDQAQALAVKDVYTDTLIYMLNERDREPVRMLTTAFQQGGQYYQLRVISPMAEEDDLIEDLFWSVFWLYIILVVSIIVINNIILRKLWKPFYDLLGQLKQFRLERSSALPEITTGIKEFNDLHLTVNTLLQQSLSTFQNQKQFVGNAAHELQTPLAIATNKLELLLEKGNLQNEQADAVADVLQIIARLVRVNKSLLLLAKIESKHFFDNQFISINNVVQQAVNDLEEFAAFKHINVKITGNAVLTVNIDASLANIIVFNIIKNAIFHNVANEIVEIAIAGDAITVSNNGDTPLDGTRIFDRFYKSSTDQSGTGLGLAIVKAICSLYGFDISYSFANGKHSFKILFKTI